MSTTSAIVANVNAYMGAAVISQLVRDGYQVKGTIGPYDNTTTFLHSYPEAASAISWVRLPYLGAPDAFDPELADVDYVVHVASPNISILAGRRRAGRHPPFLRALSAIGSPFASSQQGPFPSRTQTITPLGA